MKTPCKEAITFATSALLSYCTMSMFCFGHPVHFQDDPYPSGAIPNSPTSHTHTVSHRFHSVHSNATGDLNDNGVPNFEIDIQTPSLDELLRYGDPAEDDTMDYILQQNAKISTGIDSALIEGDVFLVHTATNNPSTSARSRGRRWTNGVVPYIIDWTFDSGSISRIHAAIDRFHETTCIRFVPRTGQTDYVHFVPRQGCWSAVGLQGGRQEISLGGSCNYHRGTIIHEIMHALGFHHEQTRPDRDDYVIIYWGNIQEGKATNFDTYPQTYLNNFYTPYDYYSIMHYPMYAFSRNGQPTIVPRLTGATIGNRNDLSATDLVKIRHFYSCGRKHDTSDHKAHLLYHRRLHHAQVHAHVTPRLQSVVTAGANNPEHDCTDHDMVNCPHWAHRGDCEMNRMWMTVNCRRSCQRCNSTTDPVTGISPNQCGDNHIECPVWARRGECNTSPSTWMRHNCRLSCNQCSNNGSPTLTAQQNCQDYNIYCGYWSRNGECLSNPAYMRMQCPNSCDICDNNTEPDEDSNTLCYNHSLYCDAWAQTGECHESPGYMLPYCRKSCGVC